MCWHEEHNREAERKAAEAEAKHLAEVKAFQKAIEEKLARYKRNPALIPEGAK